MILRNCNVCTVYGTDNEILMRPRVKCEDDRIRLYFTEHAELLSKLSRIRIDFFDSQLGFIKTFCELTVEKNEDPFVLEPWFAECTITEEIEAVQRQKDLRVRLDDEISFLTEKKVRFTGVIENISVGGIFLSTETHLEHNEVFEFNYCFGKKEHTVKAMTLREQNLKGSHLGYGCQFLGLSKAAERDIRQFVYRQQLNKMRSN